jgi:hypothetical protein
VTVAAEIADSFNALTSHPYKLGDIVLCKLNQTRRKQPRPNTQALSQVSIEDGRTIVRRASVTEDDITMMARLIEPEAWLEYDMGQGECSNMSGWKCSDSLRTAKRLLDVGYRNCAAKGELPTAYQFVKALANRTRDKAVKVYLGLLLTAADKRIRASRKARAT